MEFLGTKKRRLVNPRAIFSTEPPEPLALRPGRCPAGLPPQDVAWPPRHGKRSRCPRAARSPALPARGRCAPARPTGPALGSADPLRVLRAAASAAPEPPAAGAGPLLLCHGGEAPVRAALRSAPGLAGGRGAG